jgi:hypothetical protein
MPRATPAQTFDQIEAAVRKKTFGVFTSIDRKGRPHSTGVLYGVSPPASPFALFVLTRERYVKVRNVRMNPETTLVVTFPHRILSFVPASCVTFRGRTDVVPFADTDGRWALDQRRILRDNVASVSQVEDPVFLKLTPEPKVWCYGLGIGLLEMSKDHVGLDYRVNIPAERGV